MKNLINNPDVNDIKNQIKEAYRKTLNQEVEPRVVLVTDNLLVFVTEHFEFYFKKSESGKFGFDEVGQIIDSTDDTLLTTLLGELLHVCIFNTVVL